MADPTIGRCPHCAEYDCGCPACPPTTRTASPQKWHSSDWGRGHTAGWDEGFVRALEMVEERIQECRPAFEKAHGKISDLDAEWYETALHDAAKVVRALRERKEER